MSWNERTQVILVTNGSNTWTTTSMRNREGLVKVKMTDISSDQTWRCKTKLGIHVGTVHIYLTAIVMNSIADLLDISLEDTMSRWVSDHNARKSISVLLCFFLNFFSHDVSLLVAVNWNDFHSTDLSSSWVSSMS